MPDADQQTESHANKPTVINATDGVKGEEIWTNDGQHGDFQNVSVERSYKDGQESKIQKISLGKDALLATARALEHAHDAIVAKEQDVQPGRAIALTIWMGSTEGRTDGIADMGCKSEARTPTSRYQARPHPPNWATIQHVKRVKRLGVNYQLPPLRLYRHDLEELISILTAGHPSPELTFIADDYEFDSLDELEIELGTSLAALTIQGKNIPCPTVVIDSHPQIDTILTEDLGACAALRDYLQPKARQYVIQRDHNRYLFAIGAVAVLTATIAAIIFQFTTWSPVLSGSLLSFSGLIPMFLLVRYLPKGSIINLQRRHEHQNFWRQHNEAIIRAVFGALGTVVGGLLVYWLTH